MKKLHELIDLGISQDSLSIDIEPNYTFEGLHRLGHTRLVVFKGHDSSRSICIASENYDNPASSITNSAERLWYKVCDDYELDAEKSVFIEHYPLPQETFDVVTPAAHFVGARRAGQTVREFATVNWRRITPEEIAELIKEIGTEQPAEMEASKAQERSHHAHPRNTQSLQPSRTGARKTHAR